MDLNHRTGIITGAGSGIGRRIVLELGERGGRLLLVGRREDRLRDAAEEVARLGGQAHLLSIDVTDDGAPGEIVSEAEARLGAIDLLVNNAGNVSAGPLAETDPADIRAMIDLNLTAPILLSRAALPALRQASQERRSLLLTVSSGIALVNLPFYSTYAATKTGIAAFGHSLRRELHGSSVHVATVYPGATATEMMDSSDAGESLGFGRRPVSDVVDDLLAALERDEHEINTALPSRRRMQDMHRTAPLDVDEALAPQLAEMEAAVRHHRSI